MPPTGQVLYVLDHGWHSDLGLPIEEAYGPLARFRSVFPGARALVFSFGKRSFVTGRAGDWEQFALGVIPGPGAMQVTGLYSLPDEAYPTAKVTRLALPPGGAARLSDFIWASFELRGGDPVPVVAANPVGRFYASGITYSLADTCNRWTADAIRVAGLPIEVGGVVVESQLRARLSALCPID